MKFINRTSNVGMKKSLGVLASGCIAAALMTASSLASAQVNYEVTYPSENSGSSPKKVPANNEGFQMALGSGYSIPFGDVDSSLALSDFMSGQVPVILDIGYKKSPHFYIGGYVGYGFGRAGDMVHGLCLQGGVSCSLSTLRLGINLQYHMSPKEKLNPYIGYGIGYESGSFSAIGPGGTGELTARGFELARIAAGFDYRANPTFGIGPYLEYSVGAYFNISDGTTSLPIEGTTMHSWLSLGVRVTLFP